MRINFNVGIVTEPKVVSKNDNSDVIIIKIINNILSIMQSFQSFQSSAMSNVEWIKRAKELFICPLEATEVKFSLEPYHSQGLRLVRPLKTMVPVCCHVCFNSQGDTDRQLITMLSHIRDPGFSSLSSIIIVCPNPQCQSSAHASLQVELGMFNMVPFPEGWDPTWVILRSNGEFETGWTGQYYKILPSNGELCIKLYHHELQMTKSVFFKDFIQWNHLTPEDIQRILPTFDELYPKDVAERILNKFHN
jgi:hypothetical protein